MHTELIFWHCIYISWRNSGSKQTNLTWGVSSWAPQPVIHYRVAIAILMPFSFNGGCRALAVAPNVVTCLATFDVARRGGALLVPRLVVLQLCSIWTNYPLIRFNHF